MSKLPVCNVKGESLGDHEFPEELLVYDRGAQAVREAVTAYRAHQRAGTASTLGKSEVAGTGSKPWKQKGSGRARAGYSQSNLWRGGGVVFGPKPRSYRKRMNRKTARLAFCRAFSDQVQAGAVTVVDDLSVTEPRTRAVAQVLKQMGISGPALLVVDQVDQNLYLATRNVADLAVAAAKDVNVYQVLRYPRILVTRAGLEALAERLRKRGDQSK